MRLVSDVGTAVTLLRRAMASRSAAISVRHTLDAAPPHPSGHFQVAVYFADGAVNMYQMRQWYKPLAELAKTRPVVVLARTATGAQALLADSSLPVAFVPTVQDVEDFVTDQDIRVVLYVNQNTRNFQMFRYGRRWHVFINHGESDKMYMTTNQYKAYDFAFVAGEAARQRLGRALWDYDITQRTIDIGRPQADHLGADVPFAADERVVVLYAPTWEGDRPSAHYGSISSHGEALVRSLLATGRHRVIYRPHPRSGVIDREYGAANQRIIRALADANAADSAAQHVYDNRPELDWQLTASQVAIVDISAMIYDRLATGKPLLVTKPVDEEALVDTSGYLSDCEWLDAATTGEIASHVDRVLGDDAALSRLGTWAEYYFGDTTPGVATQKFHRAIDRLMTSWDECHRASPAA